LKQKVTADDSLFIWIYDHGYYKDENASINCWSGEEYVQGNCDLYDYELYNALKDYEYAQAIFVLGTCFSAGFLDPTYVTGTTFPNDDDQDFNLNDLSGRVIVITVQDCRPSSDSVFLGFVYRFYQAINPHYSIFNIYPNWYRLMKRTAYYGWYDYGYGMDGVGLHFTDSDKNSNDFVSMGEAFEFAHDNNDFGFGNIDDITDLPQYYESSQGLGYKTYL